MKKCLIYGIVIYLLIMMYINLSLNQYQQNQYQQNQYQQNQYQQNQYQQNQYQQTQIGTDYLIQKPLILYDENGNLKSLNYFKFKLKHGFHSYKELICMPTIAVVIALFSFILAKQLAE